MESFKIENLTFCYPNRETLALDGINLTVSQGEFITVCGKSGCGKTTLLRLLKPSLAPFGNQSGNIFFNGKPLQKTDAKSQAAEIGFVMQSPDNQIVTDKVWHELAFGLESLGYPTAEIKTRVAEMASFFGIQTWFHKKTGELSGGQKQMLNLASVVVMQPSVLILDEPTGQLDPIAAQEFLKVLEKINRELGVTVILSEHRLEDAFPMSDRVVVLDDGKIIADDKPQTVGEILKNLNHSIYQALPTPMRIWGSVPNDMSCPLTVRDGRVWLEKYAEKKPINAHLMLRREKEIQQRETVVEIKDAWFRYEKNLPDVIKGLNIKIEKGELYAIVGGNGTGKTTALSLISGLNRPYRGDVFINGEKLQAISNLYEGVLGVLPQNPQALFVKKTIYLDLMEMLTTLKVTAEEKEGRIKHIAELCCIEGLLESHPYDLSGGEQQRAALAKVLLMAPQILILDEPTKGMDAHFKEIFAEILKNLKRSGVTVVMVSHDMEFCAEYADRCAMFFDGNVISESAPTDFFAGKSFYTTSANRMARTMLPDAVTAEDVILCCGGRVNKRENKVLPRFDMPDRVPMPDKKEKGKKLPAWRIVLGIAFAILFLASTIALVTDFGFASFSGLDNQELGILHIVAIIQLVLMFFCFFPQKEMGVKAVGKTNSDRKLAKRTVMAAILILIAIPLTIYFGIYHFENRKYYFISLLIMMETMIPFVMIFESRKPQTRELIVISVLCAISVAGRTALFMLPQFKPVVALVIIAGVCFGGETGFLVGAITGFVSNFFFGQGPWTPWQMFAFGIIGFLGGILFRKGLLRKTKVSLCIYGGIASFIIYGGIMNLSSVITMQQTPTVQMIAAAYLAGMPLDLLHALATAFFLWFISEPMIDKIERVKVKYGLIER